MFVVRSGSTETAFSRTRYKALSFADSKAGKEGIVLKPEQLLAVRHIYDGRDVFLWLPTTFGKSICHEVLPFLLDLDCNLGKSESSIVIVVSRLVSLMVDQVASLRSHDPIPLFLTF